MGNRIAIWLLRSRLHWLLSRSLMVLTYRGHHTGHRHELPLQYVDHGGRLIVWAGTPEAKTWWRNFTSPRDVELTLRGRTVLGRANIIGSDQRRALTLRAYFERYPRTAPSGKPSFRKARPQQESVIARAAKDATLLEILTE